MGPPYRPQARALGSDERGCVKTCCEIVTMLVEQDLLYIGAEIHLMVVSSQPAVIGHVL